MSQHHDFYNVSFMLNASESRDMWVESQAFFVHDGDSAYKVVIMNQCETQLTSVLGQVLITRLIPYAFNACVLLIFSQA